MVGVYHNAKLFSKKARICERRDKDVEENVFGIYDGTKYLTMILMKCPNVGADNGLQLADLTEEKDYDDADAR